MFLSSDFSSNQTQSCSLQPLKEAISVLFSFTRRVLDDTQFQTDIHQWLERLVNIHKHSTPFLTPGASLNIFCCSGPRSRWRSWCILEDQESTCTCCAIYCVVLLELASGLHTSFRLVKDTVSCVLLSCQWLYMTEISSKFP